MIYPIKRLFKPIIFIAFILCAVHANAQISLIQNAIDKIENNKNFSYQSIIKQKDEPNDTTTYQQEGMLLKMPEDKNLGYLFSTRAELTGNKLFNLYNGQNMVALKVADSTYTINPGKLSDWYRSTLLGELKWLKSFSEKNPSKIVKSSDTTINANACSHLIVNTYDTIMNNDHNYSFTHLFINKLSGLPDCITTKGRIIGFGDRAINSYIEIRYADYTFDQRNISIASFTIPKGFHQRKEWIPSNLLLPGTVAPDWTLYTADGKKLSLTQMKGKVVLLDFYFIGCTGCMLSLKPLNNLYEKYKNQNVLIASITERDSEKSVLAFEEQYGIKYVG
jgi:thiol-disulfide isomerase/thioredoxin